MQHARILISVGYALVSCGLGFAKIEIERHIYHQYAPQISGIRQFICRRNTRQVLHFGGIKGGEWVRHHQLYRPFVLVISKSYIMASLFFV